MQNNFTFEHPDWSLMPEPRAKCEAAWVNQQGAIISLEHIGVDKPLRSRLSDVNEARDHYRLAFAKQGVGLIECNVFELDGIPAVYAIAKLLRKPHGAVYIGTIAMPLPKESYVFNTAAEESGITGAREAAAFIKISQDLESKGYVMERPSEQSATTPTPMVWRNAATGEVVRWAQDPYEPNFDGPCLCNMADAVEHDVIFSQHPLSRVRAAIYSLAERLKLSPKIKKAAESKPGWRFW